jgi:RNA polymerase sigma-70 factor (subfamily 1)
MAPDAQDVAPELKQYEPYLRLLVRVLCREQFHGRVDFSGVIQQTLLETWQQRQQFQRLEEEKKGAWLRQVLHNNLRDAIRTTQAQKRDRGREVSLEAALEQSSAQLENYLRSDESSPSVKAVRNEQLLHLAQALDRLSEDRREAVELHRLQGLTLEETARRMGKTKDAVAKLVLRGLAQLRKLLDGKVD